MGERAVPGFDGELRGTWTIGLQRGKMGKKMTQVAGLA